MPYFNYICDQCNLDYKEFRSEEHAQTKTICHVCGGNFIEQL
jgi:putative FmdB family regulatory protein